MSLRLRVLRLAPAALVAALALLALLGAAALGPAPDVAAADIVVCVRKDDGQVFARSTCKKNETKINLYNATQPVTLTVLTGDGQVFYGRAPKKGTRATLTTPDDTDTLTFCAEPTGLRLYYFGGGCPAGWAPLVVPPQDQPPVADAKSATLLEDGQATITLSASDADGQALTFQIAQQPGGQGTLGPITGTTCAATVPNTCTAQVTYTGNPNAT